MDLLFKNRLNNFWKKAAVIVFGGFFLQMGFAQNTSSMEIAANGVWPLEISGDSARMRLVVNYNNPGGNNFAPLEAPDAQGRVPLAATYRTLSGKTRFHSSAYTQWPSQAYFHHTSQYSSAGTGVARENGFLSFYVVPNGFPGNSWVMQNAATFEVSFNRPVDDPIIHIRGMLGGQAPTTPNSSGNFPWVNLNPATLELISPGSIERLSGNRNFVVDGTFIRNVTGAVVGGASAEAHCLGESIGDQACGSVRIRGKQLSRLAFRVDLKSLPPSNGVRWVDTVFSLSFSLIAPPILQPVKESQGDAGEFNFTYTNVTQGSGVIKTEKSRTPAPASVLRTIYPLPSELKIGEKNQDNWKLSSISCALYPVELAAVLRPLSLFNPQYDLEAGTVTIPNAEELRNSDIVCTYVNSKLPSVAIQKKTLTNPKGGGPFSFLATNLDAEPAPITTSAANTATPAVPPALFVTKLGEPVTLTEDPAPGYVLTGVTCTDANTANSLNPANRPINFAKGQPIVIPAPSANPPVNEVSLRPGAKFLCVFTNTPGAELSIDKSLEEKTVKPGQTVIYTITVKSLGELPATGALVKDKPGAGLTCAGTGPVAITGDGVPPGAFTVAQLTGTGIKLGTLAKDQSAILKFSCTVNP